MYRQCLNTGEKDFCSKTQRYRQEQAKLLQDRLSSAAGSDNLPRLEIIDEINSCIVDTCGGCLGSGEHLLFISKLTTVTPS